MGEVGDGVGRLGWVGVAGDGGIVDRCSGERTCRRPLVVGGGEDLGEVREVLHGGGFGCGVAQDAQAGVATAHAGQERVVRGGEHGLGRGQAFLSRSR